MMTLGKRMKKQMQFSELNKDCMLAIIEKVSLDGLQDVSETCHALQGVVRRVFRARPHLDIYPRDLSEVKDVARLLGNFGGNSSSVMISLLHFDDWNYDYNDQYPIREASRKISILLDRYCTYSISMVHCRNSY